MAHIRILYTTASQSIEFGATYVSDGPFMFN